jgi:hypothetical protein
MKADLLPSGGWFGSAIAGWMRMSGRVAKPRPVLVHIPKKYSHFVFGVVQSGLTCAIATGIACLPTKSFSYWATSWLISWVTMAPIVLIAAPWIGQVVEWVTAERQLGE